jgi:hypothetical protein
MDGSDRLQTRNRKKVNHASIASELEGDQPESGDCHVALLLAMTTLLMELLEDGSVGALVQRFTESF